MISKNQFGLYTKNLNSKKINNIKNYINSISEFNHFHIFYDGDILEDVQDAILPSFYMTFYKNCLIFDSVNQYLINYNKVLSSNIYILAKQGGPDINLPQKKESQITIIRINNDDNIQ
jgi:hypothetical protein